VLGHDEVRRSRAINGALMAQFGAAALAPTT
jgi:hypothetical protein